MEQLDFNNIKYPKRNIYPHNLVSNYNKKRNIEINPYLAYSKEDNKINIKSMGIYNEPNPITSKYNYRNKENEINENNVLTNYYSYPSRKMNFKQKNANINLSLMEPYYLKEELQSKYYLNYLQKKRNTFDYQDNNNNTKNIIYSDYQKVNTSENLNNDYINSISNYYKNSNKKEKNNISYEKKLFLTKLNSSKSTNDFLIGDDHDILIEYNNAPVIHSKRNNYDKYMNSFSNESIEYNFKNTYFKNIKNLRKEDNGDDTVNSIKNENNLNKRQKNLNYESYISNSINKNKRLYNENFFDVNLSNINNDNEFILDEKIISSKYNYLIDQKKQLFDQKQKIIERTNKKEIKIENKNRKNNRNIMSYNTSLNRYQIPNINKHEYNNNTTNNNINKKNIQIRKNHTTIFTSVKKGNIETSKTQLNLKKISLNNKKISNTHKIYKYNSINKNKNMANNNENKIKPELRKGNKSKRDIFYNKDYQNMVKYNNSQKKIKINSPESKENLNSNKIFVTNSNKKVTSTNYPINLSIKKNNNIEENKDKNDSIYEIFEVEYYNKSNKNNKQNKIVNKRNLPNRQKILLFKNDKPENNIETFNSVELKNNEISDIKYNLNFNTEYLKSPPDKKSNLTENFNSRDNLKFLEVKVNTTRYNNSKENNQNLVISTGNLGNEYILNRCEFKSTKNINKKDNPIINNNAVSEKKIISNSPPPNSYLKYSQNNHNKNINITENNNSCNLLHINSNYNNNKSISNKKEESQKEIFYMTECNNNTNSNINSNNNDFLKNENKKYIVNGNNKNEDSTSILKSINYNKQTNNNPVKLYLKKKELSNDNDIFVENKKTKNKNIYINNYLKHISLSNKNSNNIINKIKKYNSVANNSKRNNNIIINDNKKNNNIININNNTSNVNVLNVKNSSINICIEKKDKNDKFNILSPDKNMKYTTFGIPKDINKNKKNKFNVKNVANELLEKNKNMKNISIIKPTINKANTYYINKENDPSYIKISTNTIRSNNNIININKTENNIIKTENNIKSYKNILIKSIANYGSKIDNINNKKKLIVNNSDIFLFNKKGLNKEPSNNKKVIKVYLNNLNNIKEKENNFNNNNNLKKITVKDVNNNEIKNNKIYINRGLIKIIKPNNYQNNNNNNIDYKNINIPLLSTNSSIQLNVENKKENRSPKGIYIRPYKILSMSKPKKNIMKSKSELKMKNYINPNVNKKNTLKINKKNAKSEVNMEIYFNTTPGFYEKDEYFTNNTDTIKKKRFGSLNTSIMTKNISIFNLNDNENENNITSENKKIKNNSKSSIILYNIKQINAEDLKKLCFFHKIYKYFIKPPKIERCHFIKNYRKYHNNNKSIKYKNDILLETIKKSNIQENYNNNDDEKNNESSQNGLIMTFGEMNNKKNSYALINSNSKYNIIGNIIGNNIEDSDLDIYNSLQQVPHVKDNNNNNNNNKKEKISNENSSSNVNNSENEDLKIYESIERDKYQSKDSNSGVYKYIKSTNGKEIDEDYDEKKSKTFKKSTKYNLENAEKGLNILGRLVLRHGIKSNESNDETLTNVENSHTENKKNEKIYLGTNKLNDLFNSRKETESSNSHKKFDDYILNLRNKIKYSRSVNKDIMQGISKIENVFEKNNNNFDITNIKEKINTYDAKNRINYENNSNDIEYTSNHDYSEILKTKIKTIGQRTRTNLGSSNDNNTFDSYIDMIKYNNEDGPKYKESEIILNKNKSELRNSNATKDSLLPIKCNLLNDEIFNQFNHCNDMLTYSEEDLKSHNFSNSKISVEEFEKYIKTMKNKQSNNNVKHDLIYLLNILVDNNYLDILNQITKIILYKRQNKKNEININILNSNDDIIENEHIFKDIIFTQIKRGVKFVVIFAKICNDINNNISKIFSDDKNMKYKKERNLKVIINNECISILNNFKNIKINNNCKENDLYFYFLRKHIIGYVSFVYELINIELLKQQYGFNILEQFYKIYNNNSSNNVIKEIYLEAIIILINKLGKIIFIKKNNKLIQNINNYIDNNLKIIVNNENKNKIKSSLVYRIINLIERRDNNWKDNLNEILEKENNDNNTILLKDNILNNKQYGNMGNKIWNKEINIDELNQSIIEEDLANYISYFTEENNKGQINIKNNIDKSYNWKIIEELVNNKKFGLEAIINYFISVCQNIVHDDNKLLIANDYIKNIIEYYANNLSKQAIESIHNKMINTFLNIDEIVNKNQNMYKILGNLLFTLIENKLYHIKFFNHYLKLDKQTQINLAIITKYCIISSGKFTKKYLNDFKQTKLFLNNEIFVKYVIEALKDLIYFIQ